MTPELHQLIGVVRERFPHLDVRTDQCDIVRIIGRRVLVGIEQHGSEFQAKFIALDGESDFESDLHKIVSSTDRAVFESQMLQALADV